MTRSYQWLIYEYSTIDSTIVDNPEDVSMTFIVNIRGC